MLSRCRIPVFHTFGFVEAARFVVFDGAHESQSDRRLFSFKPFRCFLSTLYLCRWQKENIFEIEKKNEVFRDQHHCLRSRKKRRLHSTHVRLDFLEFISIRISSHSSHLTSLGRVETSSNSDTFHRLQSQPQSVHSRIK